MEFSWLSLEELRTSGRIGLLTDEEVRRALTRHTQFMEQVRAVEALTRDTQLSYVDPFLMEYGDMGLIGRAWNVSNALPNSSWDPQSLIDAEDLLNLANKKIGDLDVARRRTREMTEHLNSLLRLLQSEQPPAQ